MPITEIAFKALGALVLITLIGGLIKLKIMWISAMDRRDLTNEKE